MKWLFHPDDNMILAEFEQELGEFHNLEQDERKRLLALGVPNVPGASRSGSEGMA